MDKIKHLANKYSIARYDLIRECDGDELKFYLYLKLYAINKHEAFPTFNTIKKDLGWGKSKISRLIKTMVDFNRLKIGKRIIKTSRGRQLANIYDITWYDKVNERGSKNATKGFQNQNTLSNTIFNENGEEKCDIKDEKQNKGVAKMIPKQVSNINNITNIAEASSAPPIFNLKDELNKLKTSSQRHIQLIGEYLEEKKVPIESKEQLEIAKGRHFRDAAKLAKFSDKQIGEATVKAEKEYPDYILGTLVKILTR